MARAFGIFAVLLLVGSTCAATNVAKHPLAPLIHFSEKRLQSLDKEIRDYSCTLIKRERIDGELRDYEHILLKLRHEQRRDGNLVVPFSVYMRYLAPLEVVNREVVFVQGRNQNKIIVWRGGPRLAYVTTSLAPDSDLALRWGHYPISELGIKNLTERLLEMGKQEMARNECKVEYVEGAKINGRSCLMIELSHPVRRSYFPYSLARVFIDDELKLPIRYASYDWPATEGADPPLIEEYSYVDIKLNVGFSDQDFDYHNPAYRFRKTFEP